MYVFDEIADQCIKYLWNIVDYAQKLEVKLCGNRVFLIFCLLVHVFSYILFSSDQLMPLFALFPINLAGICFDKENLNYGTYATTSAHMNAKQKALTDGRHRVVSESKGNKT